MIISASRRTDIPAFYSEWFFNRIKAGFVMVRNPTYRHKISKIDLNPEVVDCIVFWTKDPKNMFKNLDLLDQMKYNYYFQFTLTPYGKDIETNVPAKEEIIASFQYLSDKIGKNKVIWRYDPIFLTDKITTDYHIKHFELLAKKLHKHTEKCIISFVDLHQKNKRNREEMKLLDIDTDTMRSLAKPIYDIAQSYGIAVEACAEKIDLSDIGIRKAKCVDGDLISQICGGKIKLGKDKAQREACGCIESTDIGAKNTCNHRCLYCYATNNCDIATNNLSSHNSQLPLLTGEIESTDIITEKKMKSCVELQTSIFSKLS